ncbi:unnamed protein product [Ceutorhynchus assimilis]|uniref:BESS domain-containing protein n=1 Tax=Ceutorhynchus assimilis TaxID=467358 RepID=A0A9N9MFB9_9CUCU|nr:unnamed protein product [Ceutorhynchus assimilis]
MDAVVRWNDGTENIVLLSQIQCVNESEMMKIGSQIKMRWKPQKKWYYGTILEMENTVSSSNDSELDIPLKKLRKKMSPSDNNESFDSDEPLQTVKDKILHQRNSCLNVVTDCVEENKEKSTSTCAVMVSDKNQELSNSEPLYQDDSNRDRPSVQHCEVPRCEDEVWAACPNCLRLLCWTHFIEDGTCDKMHSLLPAVAKQSIVETRIPEQFVVEGNSRENDSDLFVKKRENMKRKASQLRNRGEAYISYKTKKEVPARRVDRSRCDSSTCRKIGKKCDQITDEERQQILNDFYTTGDLQLQREFITRHVNREQTKQKTTSSDHDSRRSKSNYYFLPKGNTRVPVCKTMFLYTLSISEKFLRTSLGKLKNTGIVEPEKRGGRNTQLKQKDRHIRELIVEHIKRFPRMESHYCRKKTTREYLHSDLTVKKIYSMFIDEKIEQVSYALYLDVFKGLRLSFHNPKKDQCGLCFTYRQGDLDKKLELEETYQQHILEKEKVRYKKQQKKSDPNPLEICTVFDLQQVIFLPITIENSCSGQNKNSIVISMFLHVVSLSKHIRIISISFFEPYHGQNEGDSAHSAIDNAVKRSGDLFLPSQLAPILKLARRNNPYIVHLLTSDDFINFKKLSQDLKIVSARKDDAGNSVDWKNVREVMVTKDRTGNIYFKNSHLQEDYRYISLNRTALSPCSLPPRLNHPNGPKISAEKYKDLMDLCRDDCKNKRKLIRSAYIRSINNKAKSGSGAGSKKEYYLAQYLKFLNPFTKNLRQESNITSQCQNQDTIDHGTLQTEYSEESQQEAHETDAEEDHSREGIPSPPVHSNFDTNVSSLSCSETPHCLSSKTSRKKTIDDADKCAIDYFDIKKKIEDKLQKESKKSSCELFLLSLIPHMESMTDQQQLSFQRKALQLLQDVKSDTASADILISPIH